MLEHLQFYVSDMSPSEHAECGEIIKMLRGSKRTTLGAYVTHIVVDENVCQIQEKRTILEFLEQSANVCTVVDPSWLRSCAQVRTLTHRLWGCGYRLHRCDQWSACRHRLY